MVVPADQGTDGAAAETAEVAAAATEAVADAFRQGVNAGEMAAIREDGDREELAELRRRVDALEARQADTAIVAEVALEVAAEAASEAVEAEAAAEAGTEGDGPKPPPRRAEPAEEASAPVSPAASPAYGARGWYGARG